jgi:uroporphyrinogen decarboxylase
MTSAAMTPMQRVLTALSHQEPDRVPFILLPALQGARELGLSIRDYFSKASQVAEGQWRLQAKFQHDCLYTFYYAAIEMEAWGSETIFRDDGPPNAGPPVIQSKNIPYLTVPRIADCPALLRVLDTTQQLAERAHGEIPIIGVVMSPFSLPIMQMGFEAYLQLLYEQREQFKQLLRLNEEFCVAWAEAQCAAGVNTICYFDPMSSSTLIPPDLYRQTGFPCARRTLARIPAPVALHLASGRGLPIVDDLMATGAAVLGVSSSENLSAFKSACRGQVGLLGNLNGVMMRRWTVAEAEQAVKACIAKAGPGGGYLLADNHGEIPWQVSDEVLLALSDAAHVWGRYPLDWIDDEA